MEHFKKEQIVYQICSKRYAVNVGGIRIRLRNITPEIRLRAALLYEETLRNAELDGAYTEEELCALLLLNGFWSTAEEDRLAVIPKEIENLKVRLYQTQLRSNDRKLIRAQLKLAKEEYNKLYLKRHAMDYASCVGVASLAKTQFMIEKSIISKGIEVTGEIVQSIIEEINSSRPTEKEIREIARTDPWRSIWSNCGGKNPFGRPSSCWSDEQLTLCSWSKLYDNIHKSPDCPPDEVIDDDDMLDGWLILQSRKRKEDANKKDAETGLNDKSRNASEVFIMAQTKEDAQKIESLNDPMTRAIKRQRNAILNKHGSVDHDKLPDVQQELMMQFNNLQRRGHG